MRSRAATCATSSISSACTSRSSAACSFSTSRSSGSTRRSAIGCAKASRAICSRSGWRRGVRSGSRRSGGSVGVNPDQRMTDDAAKLCDISTDLSIGLFRSTVLFVSFASVLWTISKDFTFRVERRRVRDSGLHAVGRDFVFRGRLAAELLRRPGARAVELRSLRARGGPALRARRHQRAHRRHCARGRRGRRAAPRRDAS